jgi:hypothetical protein
VQELERRGELPQLDRSPDVKGPDANSNGIRDDVESYITSWPVTSEQKKAAEQLARSVQAALLVDLTSSDTLHQVDDSSLRAVQCIHMRFPDVTKRAAVISAIERVTVNTKERTARYIKYNQALSGTATIILTGDTCDN